MQWLRSVIIFDRGNLAASPDWNAIHDGYTAAIRGMAHPDGAQNFTIRRKTRKLNARGERTSQWNRNGVTPIKNQFLERMRQAGWRAEEFFELELLEAELHQFPNGDPFVEAFTATPGEFDFFTRAAEGTRVAIEWETGNISSSHRSLNKLCLYMITGQIDAGVLIVPSRAMYEHLTDRVGNWEELGPYLPYWNRVGALVVRGLLVVSVVEHDALTDDAAIPYIRTEAQGRAEEGAARLI